MAEKKVIKLNESQLRKIVKESVSRIINEAQGNNENPAIYVGTYGKYNSGSLKGEWVDLTNFDSKEDFYEYCRELHSDEKDPEFMFQDWEYIPDGWVGESYVAEELWDSYIPCDYENEVKMAVAEHCSKPEEFENVIDNVIVHYGCDDMSDVAYKYIEEFGGEDYIEQCLKNDRLTEYIDYEMVGRDYRIDWDDSEGDIYECLGLDDNASDEEIGEALEEQGLLEGANLSYYFDYERYGRDLEYDSTFIPTEVGYVEIVG